jgi:hypothetical protein
MLRSDQIIREWHLLWRLEKQPGPALTREIAGHSQKERFRLCYGDCSAPFTVAGRFYGRCNMTEVLPIAEGDSGTAPRASSNIRHLCRMELAGGGQIVIGGKYAYVGHQHRPQGTTILDISNPQKPKVLSTLTPGHPWSHSHKVRIAGGYYDCQLRVRGRPRRSPGRIP